MCDQHDFVFEFDKAYTSQLVEKFEASPQHDLVKDIAPRKKGVYALYHKGTLVYAGKAMATLLRGRLNEHLKKIGARRNLKLGDMSCRFLVIDSDWHVRAAEHTLITTYKPEWNGSGVGSKVPGAGRPGIRVSKFDSLYPPEKD
ncbi:MAG: Eco29kI family restriction endonuclease [Acidobacteriia bacterium]|nr:Eco29kI family restriction endonuclease [Terriglobia bacterium]